MPNEVLGASANLVQNLGDPRKAQQQASTKQGGVKGGTGDSEAELKRRIDPILQAFKETM